MKRLTKLLLYCASTVVSLIPCGYAAADSGEQFIAIPSYRVGPYGTNGQAFYGGFIDYLSYVDLKEGGVNGVKLTW